MWSVKTTGALPRRRNRVRARRADGRVAGASRRDGRPWLTNCRRAMYTARHSTYFYTRGARHYGTRLEGTLTRSNTKLNGWARGLDQRRPMATEEQPGTPVE
ncbi:hypothetical protein EVAR_38942_1 [Eumeta japonica]|uniref:Uncharacterized protein n=1 Tax=Eumeta variegata TaxID=151549 RepID=A0A4C1W8E7_EUMVA|nr:hypothetical protein EVAR_38942_1 [Eumeta japonica]